MFEIFKDLSKNNVFRIKTDNERIELGLRRLYSCPNPAARFSPHADSTLSAISPLGSFSGGLAEDIIKWVSRNFPDEQIDISNIVNDIRPGWKVSNFVDPVNTQFKLRDYQMQSVISALKYGRGTFELATSAGKSLIISSILQNIFEIESKKLPVLILVPTIQLVTQFYQDLLDYGFSEEDVCKFSSFSKSKPTAPIIISNRQWLQNHADKLPYIHVCIIDECHQLKKGSGVSKLIANMKTAHKFAFTGTLPEQPVDRWNVIGLCGSVHHQIKAHELQNIGSVANTNIASILIEHDLPQPESDDLTLNALQRAKLRFPLEWKFIESSHKANRFMANLCLKLKGNTIVLFDHIEHGQLFLEICKELANDKLIFFIDGSIPLDYREDVIKQMEKHSNCILLAQTKTFGTGTSIKNIKNICFAFSAGTSTTKIIQAIGRGMRLMDGKTDMFLYDFYHSFKYSKDHYKKRIQMYKTNYNLKTFREWSYTININKMRLENDKI